MQTQLNQIKQPGEHCQPEQSASRCLSTGLDDFNQQCLRVLRCTAQAMASSPGGLRFKAGTRPWLVGLAGSSRHVGALSLMAPAVSQS